MKKHSSRLFLSWIYIFVIFLFNACSNKNTSSFSDSHQQGQSVPLRTGLVLEDNVRAFNQPFSNESESSIRFNTGDTIEITSIKRKVDGESEKVSYEIIFEGKAAWINGNYIYAPDDNWSLNRFITGTWIPESYNDNGIDKDKFKRINSLEFLEQMAHNAKPETRSIAYRKLLWIATDPDAIIKNWQLFFSEKDPYVRSHGIDDLIQRIETLKYRIGNNKAIDLIDKALSNLPEEETATLIKLKNDISNEKEPSLPTDHMGENAPAENPDVPEVVLFQKSLDTPTLTDALKPNQIPKIWDNAKTDVKVRLVTISCRPFRTENELAFKVFELAYNDAELAPYQLAKKCIAPVVSMAPPGKNRPQADRIKKLLKRVKIKDRSSELKALVKQ